MKDIRRKEKAIQNPAELQAIILEAKYITIAMCHNNEPYLVTLIHGFDAEKNCLYFHCAGAGKKVEILKENAVVWGQALMDKGYIQGKCDHLYATAQFRGKVTFLDNHEEKKEALINMIHRLENDPQTVVDNQITSESVDRVTIGRIDIDFMSGKKADKVKISI